MYACLLKCYTFNACDALFGRAQKTKQTHTQFGSPFLTFVHFAYMCGTMRQDITDV